MIVVAAAAEFGAYASPRQDDTGIATLWLAAGLLAVATQALVWRRRSRRPQRWLEFALDGALQLREAGRIPLPVQPGANTRLLGPSVLVDLDPGVSSHGSRIRCWLTPLDLPRADLRRLTIVLLASGRVART
jgi:hypothetical protein